jgi:hypothetical protein
MREFRNHQSFKLAYQAPIEDESATVELVRAHIENVEKKS